MENIKEVLDTLMKDYDKSKVELYKRFTEGITIDKIKTSHDFYWQLTTPYEKFKEGFIAETISKDKNLIWLLLNYKFVENHIARLIRQIEGDACSSDKTRNIIHDLTLFFKEGILIDYSESKWYQPRKIFNTHEQIIEFFTSLQHLYYGNPEKYLMFYKNYLI